MLAVSGWRLGLICLGGRGSTACCPSCSWFLVRRFFLSGQLAHRSTGQLCVICRFWSFFAFWASGPLPLSTCQHVNVSPRSYASKNRSPRVVFNTLSESLKRPSVRLGAPTASARHWLSQRKTVHQKLLILSSKFVIEINTHERQGSDFVRNAERA